MRSLIPLAATYGHWTVLQDLPFAPGTERRVLCRCACGVERAVAFAHLRSGQTTRCRSCATRARIPLPLEPRYGERVVIGEAPARRGRQFVLCRCACGSESVISLAKLRSGTSRRCKACALDCANAIRVGRARDRQSARAAIAASAPQSCQRQIPPPRERFRCVRLRAIVSREVCGARHRASVGPCGECQIGAQHARGGLPDVPLVAIGARHMELGL
jgi:hypothetical protein